jgi:hypothetical protein
MFACPAANALQLVGGLTLVTADAASVSWLTGLAVEIELGSSPFAVPPVAEGPLIALSTSSVR